MDLVLAGGLGAEQGFVGAADQLVCGALPSEFAQADADRDAQVGGTELHGVGGDQVAPPSSLVLK